MLFDLISALLIMYMLYCIIKDFIKGISNPKKYLRDHKPNENNGIYFIDFD